jgi:hypothetical protein
MCSSSGVRTRAIHTRKNHGAAGRAGATYRTVMPGRRRREARLSLVDHDTVDAGIAEPERLVLAVLGCPTEGAPVSFTPEVMQMCTPARSTTARGALLRKAKQLRSGGRPNSRVTSRQSLPLRRTCVKTLSPS